MKINEVTIQNVNLLSSVDEFSEKFTDCQVITLIDFLLKYNQIKLTKHCRNMTAFMISLKLLRITTLLQEVMNSVIQFVCIVTKILENHIKRYTDAFLNDIRV